MGEFRQEKLAGLLAYLAYQSLEDRYFSVVKAAKLLTFIDFTAFERFGEPITHAQYIKLPAGPVPRQFNTTLNTLVAGKQLEVRRTVLYGREQKRILAKPAADWSALTAPEISLAEEKFQRHLKDRAIDLRDLSHDLPGWALVTLKQEIPYHTALITLAGPNERDYADSEALAARLGWA